MENTKICKKCNIEKGLNDFYKRGKGFQSNCKNCEIKRTQNYISKNRDSVLEKNKIRYYNNHDLNLKKKQEYDFINRDIVRKRARNAYSSEKAKKYYKENKERILERNKLWIENNKEHFKILNRKNIKKWMKENPHVVVWRQILYRTIYQFGKRKEASTNEMLGYSAIDLKDHIENLFQNGMSWTNWGEWHIDHIKPLNTFDKNSPINIINALSNLRPLWAKENLKRKKNPNIDNCE